MPTDRQSAASRANAQKSTGPRTEFGKASSRFNALKHGIDAKQQIMFTESAGDLAELAAEYHELHHPADTDGRFLVDTLVNNEWRLRRMRRVEADLWNDPDATAARPGIAFKTTGPAFDRLQRVVTARQARPSDAAEVVPAPQPEESKPTSESSASFPTNPETEPEAPENPAAATQPSLHEQLWKPRGPIAASDPTVPATVRQC